MSKGGFLFPAAKFISQNMKNFEKEILLNLPAKYESNEAFIKDIAIVHGGFLLIHPFREGNGRTARLLANLMVRKQGMKGLNFYQQHFVQQLHIQEIPFQLSFRNSSLSFPAFLPSN